MKIITLCFALLLSTSLMAKTENNTKKSSVNYKEFFKDIKVDRVGAHLGLVKPSEIDPAIGFGIDLPLGTITKHHIEIRTGLEYWTKSTGALDTSDFILSGYGLYNFKQLKKLPITPYAGGGVSFHFVSADAQVGPVVVSGSDTNLGLDIVGGGIYDYKKNLDFFTEAKWRLVSDVGQLSFVAGAVYRFR